MSEVVMLPEMLAAGMEALAESRDRGCDDDQICVAVFLAMRAIEEMALVQASRSVH